MFHLTASPHNPQILFVSSDMGGAFRSIDGGRNWNLIHHRYIQGNTQCPFVFHPQQEGWIFFPANPYSSTIMVSRDYGERWDIWGSAPENQPIKLLFFMEKVFLVVTEKGLYRWEEISRTWTQAKGISGSIHQIAGNSTNLWVTTSHHLYCSTDLGQTFFRLSLPDSPPILSITANQNYLYLSLQTYLGNDNQLKGGIYRSKDLGQSWQRIMHKELDLSTNRKSPWANGDLPQYRFLLTSTISPQRVYVYCTGTSYFPPNHSTIYRSDNAGDSWYPIFFSDPRFRKLYNVEDDRISLELGQRYQYPPISISINPLHPDWVYMATDMTLFVTNNGGKNWYLAERNPPLSLGNHYAFVSNGLGVTTAWWYYIDPFQSHRHYICYTDIGFARSLDAGQTWIWEGKHIPWKNTCYNIAFDPEIPGKIWGAFSQTHDIPNYNVISGKHKVIMEGGVGLSLDYGDTWKKLNLPEAPCTDIVLDHRSPKNQRTLYAALWEKGIFRSQDDGKTWHPLPSMPGLRDNQRFYRILLHSDGTLFALITAKRLAPNQWDDEGPGLFVSHNQGISWKKISPSFRWPKDFSVHPKNSQIILLGVANLGNKKQSGLYRTQNQGQTWECLASLEAETFGGFFHPQHPNWIYLTCCEGASTSGLYLSQDNGTTWKPFSSLPFANIMRITFPVSDPGKIYLATFGASVLYGPETPE